MTTPDHQSPAPDAPEPESKDRIYRSAGGIAGGVLLLAIFGWLGIDALIAGEGRTPWIALAALLLSVPLIVAFTLRPAVFADDDRLRVRNPFRVIVLPWGTVASLRSGYSNEVTDTAGTKFQLWAVPVSLRARKRAARRQARAESGRGGAGPVLPDAPVRAQTDQVMDELRELFEARAQAPGSRGEVSVRWAYEVLAPAAAGAVLLAILLAVG
ncbi:PH domain-containing protein [Streptomyces minutiscleroticus]|uniref:Membrane protein n=1 Tax=Streptomyces minutiscleroticus TaxID=68238 RepID=A0A918KD07_9ACTN|nr:PH domain-containing protein [Streptomyces minutiscleroticus]GGX57963.1 membrane protein [Streptomyces minutiscleroticus]